MHVITSCGARVYEKCGQLFGLPGILALRSLYERTCREEDVHAERSAQDPVQGDAEGSGQREEGWGFEAATDVVSRPLNLVLVISSSLM